MNMNRRYFFLSLATSPPALLAPDFWQARNALTQRAIGPESVVTTEVGLSRLRPGDVAGLALLNGPYAWLGAARTATGSDGARPGRPGRSADCAHRAGRRLPFQWQDMQRGDLMRQSLHTHRYLFTDPGAGGLCAANAPGPDRRDAACFGWTVLP